MAEKAQSPSLQGRAEARTRRGSKWSLGWSDSPWLLVIDGHLEKLPQTHTSVKTHQTPTVSLRPVYFAVGNSTAKRKAGVGERQ